MSISKPHGLDQRQHLVPTMPCAAQFAGYILENKNFRQTILLVPKLDVRCLAVKKKS